MIKKEIILISDILMTAEKEQFSNLRWFRDILDRRILKATGSFPLSMTSSLTNVEQFSRNTFFNLSNVKLDIDELQFYFDDEEITSESIDFLLEFLPVESVVVAYELSRQTRRVLDRAGIVYIDVWLHPIRYLDDILFAFNTNCIDIRSKIDSYHMDEEYFYLYADKFKISTYKGFKRVEVLLEQNSALFIGQTLTDKAICLDGKMLNLLDYKDKFINLTKKYNKVYYSRHPFVGSGDKHILKWLEGFSNVEVVQHSAYHLLANPNIKSVHTISSSVVHEARFFNKESHFWFKPIFMLSRSPGKENYLSIYQDFVSPSFWSDILSPVVDTEPCQSIKFLSEKDKMRDMLGFYYSYKHVDKSEQARQTLLAVDRKVQRIDEHISSPIVNTIKKKTIQTQPKFAKYLLENLSLAKRLIKKSEVVSFDIFDTLIQRKVESPNDIFSLMDIYAISLGIKNFSYLRGKSRGFVVDPSGEEIPLSDRYSALVSRGDLEPDQAKSLLQYELDLELRVCERRLVGCELLAYALANKKRVVLISDIFFEKTFVETILANSGVNKYEKLYVSSEIGLLKHTGNLFHYVSNNLNVKPAGFIHFGDNYHADGEMARKHGFGSFILPSNKIISDQVSYYTGPLGFDHPYVESVAKGLVNNKLFDGMFGDYSKGIYNRDPKKFGYCAMGPMFSAFAAWLLKQSKKDGIETLYFLARDGEIIKKCYDILAEGDKGAPKSEYLLCSRRSVNVPRMQSIDDIVEVASVNFSPVTLKEIIFNRFGVCVSKFKKESLRISGFEKFTDTIRFKEDLEKFIHLLKLESEILLECAKEERYELLSYFDKKSFLENGKFAVVDIGHNGTMQRSLSHLTRKPDLAGYYFVTYKGAEKTLGSIGLPYSSFLAHNADGKDNENLYSVYILMFELLFLNTSGSFVRFKNGKHITLPLNLEKKRIKFIEHAHAGCIKYVDELFSATEGLLLTSSVDPHKIISPHVEFLRSPRFKDAEMFEGICFENVYSARNSQFICQYGAEASSVVWKEGQNSLNEDRFSKFPIYLNHIMLIANKIKIINDNKYRKFITRPDVFFKDSRYRFVRRLGYYN